MLFLISLPENICSDRPKYFPWLTFNFRLRTGHKSGLCHLRSPIWCFRVCNVTVNHMWQWLCYNAICSGGKKSCYLLRMLHPLLVALWNNILTPGLVQNSVLIKITFVTKFYTFWLVTDCKSIAQSVVCWCPGSSFQIEDKIGWCQNLIIHLCYNRLGICRDLIKPWMASSLPQMTIDHIQQKSSDNIKKDVNIFKRSLGWPF